MDDIDRKILRFLAGGTRTLAEIRDHIGSSTNTARHRVAWLERFGLVISCGSEHGGRNHPRQYKLTAAAWFELRFILYILIVLIDSAAIMRG